MIRADLLPKPQVRGNPRRRLHAFFASCVLHGLGLSLLLWIAIYYQAHLPPPRSGSAPSAPSITLSTLVIVSTTPPSLPTPAPAKPPPPVPPTPTASMAPPPPSPPPPQPEVKPQPPPPDQGVPVLAVQPPKPEQEEPPKVESAKITAPPHPVPSHTVAATAESHPKPSATAASFPSSYAPGASDLPHPPFPDEARDRKPGTVMVVVNVQFNASGDVTQVEVTQSSGVPVLDRSTRTFIRAHWHSPAYAGQTVSVPVEYKLESL